MSRFRSLLVVLGAVACLAGAWSSSAIAGARPAGDVARYILPPGNYGGLPFTANSTDQLPLYSGLTPLRDQVTMGDINDLFLPEDFRPIGATTEEDTGRPGLRLIYDSYGIPHVYGKTRADVAFGAGWTTARDRALLLQLGRGPARAAVADVPNLNAFGLVTSGRSFVPSAEAEALVTKQRRLLVKTYGKKGKKIIADARAYAAGVNAYWEANDIDNPPATVNDVIAVTAFIGSIFGAGGGGEAANADLLAKLQEGLGVRKGSRAWDDVMLADDPEAPTTIKRRFNYPTLTGGRVKGSVVLDPGSIESDDPTVSSAEAAAAPARKQASNFLVASARRSATGNPLAVMGPQLGYYYPEIVQQIDLHGPGIKAQGAAVPGLAMYILIGRTEDYAWSLTSAGHDVRDVYAERLCEPDGSKPSRSSTHYRYKGRCMAFERFNAGELDGEPVSYDVSVHGPVFATATVDGKPYALSRKRSTFGRDGLNLAALHDMTRGKASRPSKFWKAANQFGFTFHWAYTSREKTAYFTSGELPQRPRGLDRPAADARHRQVRVAGLAQPPQAPARGRRLEGPAAELEQPVGARVHARRRRALRLRPPGRGVRPVAAAGDDHRQRRDHEPGRDRGPALAGLADRQRGAARRPGAERPRRAGRRPARRLGRAATRRGSTSSRTGPTTRPGRRSWTGSGGGSPRP